MIADRTEHRIHSQACNRVDWRSTLRYAATAKRRWERDLMLFAFFVQSARYGDRSGNN